MSKTSFEIASLWNPNFLHPRNISGILEFTNYWCGFIFVL